MKKTIYLSLALLFSANLSAQNPDGWIQEGAEWHYANESPWDGYIHYTYSGTETIDGVLHQKINGVGRYNLYNNGEYFMSNTFTYPTFFFRTSNDSIYLKKTDGSTQFVWHRNPSIGDVWNLGYQVTSPLFDTLFEGFAFALVYDIQEEYIHGVLTKNIFTTACKDEFGTLPNAGDSLYNYAYARKINSLYGPIEYFISFEPYLDVFPINNMPYIKHHLLCYSSVDTPLYQTDLNNDCFNGVSSIDDLSVHDFTLYPNPASTSITITTPEHINSIHIFDAQGRLQLRSESLPVDVRSMTSGVYWVQIETVDGQVKTEKLLVE